MYGGRLTFFSYKQAVDFCEWIGRPLLEDRIEVKF